MRLFSRLLTTLALVALPVVALSAVAHAKEPARAAATAADLPLTGTIAFTGSKVTGSHTIVAKDWTGTVALRNGKPEGGQLAFTVRMAALDADPGAKNDWTPKLEEHLKSPDFFDVAKHPTASFTSLEIKAGGSDGATHTIKGNLTLRGVTKTVAFPATLSVRGKDIAGKTKFSINRKDFGIVYAGKADDLIRDGVVLEIDVKATQQ